MTPTLWDKIKRWLKYENGYFKTAFVTTIVMMFICLLLAWWYENKNIYQFIWYCFGSFYFLSILFFMILLRYLRIMKKNLSREIENGNKGLWIVFNGLNKEMEELKKNNK